MKWLVVILIVTNLAAYLLVGGRQPAAETVKSDSGSDVNKTGMLLLAEVDALRAATTDAGTNSQPTANETVNETLNETANDSDQATAGDTPAQAAGSAESLADSSSGEQPVAEACYRLGPFSQEESWQAAKTWMDESGFEFMPVISDSRQLLAFRVYLGPFASESSADEMLKKLKDSGLEHFRYTADNGLTRISMGLFSQEELAEKYLDYLASNQYEAKFQPEYRRLGPLNWMEISSAEIDYAQVSGHEWDESGVGISQVNCRI